MKKKFSFTVLSVFFLCVVLFALANQFYVDYLWFNETGYTQVFMKEIRTKLIMGLPLFLIFFVLYYFYLKFLTRIVVRYSSVVVNYKRPVLFLSTIMSLFSTILVVDTTWYKFLEFQHAVEFSFKDPIFDKDISFYLFKLPLLEQLHTLVFSLMFIIAALTIIYTSILYFSNPSKKIQYFNDGSNGKFSIKPFLKEFFKITWKQILVFVGLFFLILAYYFYISRFSLLYSESGIAFGASYTDEKITLKLYEVMMVLSMAIGLFTIFFGLKMRYKQIAIGPVLLAIVYLAGNLLTFGVDRVVVSPNEFQKEEPYLLRSIQYTRKAYGIDDVMEKEVELDDEISIQDIEDNRLTIDNIPINDYRPTLEMFNSIQGFRLYYEFSDIDIDRYDIDGKYTQVFISAREMNNQKLEENAKTWINTHLKYTHGYGVAVSPVNTIDEAGQPSLIVKDIPSDTNIASLQIDEPRIYFGEKTDTYAITNCKTKEFDYPKGSENEENFYEGTAGIKLNFLNRLAFSIYHRNLKILLSTNITSDSRMLIRRNIIDRANTIAPFLVYDEDPYIVVADKKLYWIIDAFTVSDRFPYSQPYSQEEPFNYIRNSVKVVVDAYNGDVDFYQVDEDDAVINVYNKIYPNMFKPMSEMPQSIMKHVRYSQEMFDIQANVYRTYHMSNTRVFYNKEDQWEIATQMYGQDKEPELVESAYLVMKQPGADDEEFVLMVPYTPRQKDNMIGWMAAMNDEENYGELVVYKFSKQKLTYGPMQIEQRIDQDTDISPQLTLLGQQGSEISRGNMLTIPINNSILYVEPVYIKASTSERKIPEVKKVIVSYGNKIVMEQNLDTALEKLFGVLEEDEGERIETPQVENDVGTLIIRANELFNSAQQAQQSGNWAEYGRYIDELKDVLEQLNELSQVTE